MEQNQEPRNKPMLLQSTNILTREPKTHNGEKRFSQINCTGKLDIHKQKNKTIPLS